jgi:hypothetical protein
MACPDDEQQRKNRCLRSCCHISPDARGSRREKSALTCKCALRLFASRLVVPRSSRKTVVCLSTLSVRGCATRGGRARAGGRSRELSAPFREFPSFLRRDRPQYPEGFPSAFSGQGPTPRSNSLSTTRRGPNACGPGSDLIDPTSSSSAASQHTKEQHTNCFKGL